MRDWLITLRDHLHRISRKLYERWILLTDKIPIDNWRIASLHSIPFWIGAVVSALVAVTYSKVFYAIERVSDSIIAQSPLWFFLLSPALLFIGWFMVARFAKAASGSGIPQLMAALTPENIKNDKKLDYLFGVRVFIVKITSSLTGALGGAVIGREGPTIQLSASVFYLIHKFLPKKWPRISRERMLIAGGAAGLAAAFNTPLGGIVFVIEELSSTHIKYFRSSLLFAVVFAGITAQMILGPYLYLGYPSVGTFSFHLVPYVIIFSTITSISGALTAEVMLMLIKAKSRFTSFRQNALFVIFCGLLLATLIFLGRENAIGSGRGIMGEILFYNHNEMPWYLFPLRAAGMIVSYASGIAGGVFSTSLSAGAAMGYSLQELFSIDMDSKVLILVSMIGFLTGVSRSPFTSSVLVLEMTDRHSAIFYLMMAGVISFLAARVVSNRSFYHHLEKNYH